MIEFARDYYNFFLLAHVVAAALGLGAATVTDFLFFKFLKDFKVTKEEASTLSNMSQIIWVILIVVIISGIAIYLPQMERLNQAPNFQMKLITFAVLILNGIGLNLLISPRIEQIFSEGPMNIPRYWRRLAFVGGAISITSWYSTFILGSFKGWSQDFQTLFTAYVCFVLVGIVASQISEAVFHRKTSR